MLARMIIADDLAPGTRLEVYMDGGALAIRAKQS